MTNTVAMAQATAMTTMTTTATVLPGDLSPSILTTLGLVAAPATSLENCGEGSALRLAETSAVGRSRSKTELSWREGSGNVSGVWDGCGRGSAVNGVGEIMANSVCGVGMQSSVHAMSGEGSRESAIWSGVAYG